MERQDGSALSARLKLISSMFIFGTIGIFVRYISMPSSIIALVRGFVGVAFLALVTLIKRTEISKNNIKKNLKLLIPSGMAIGINWILLFEAYNYTTVATATLCYYFAPIFVIIASPLVIREKLTAKKIICVLTALLGMIFVSGVAENGIPQISEMKGILFGVGAALLYASVILMNQKISGISAYEKTIMQLLFASLVLLPYTLLTEDFSALSLKPLTVGLLIFVGIVHTGIAYSLYFSSMNSIGAQSVALMSYIDPIVAIILSAVLLKEDITVWGVLGAVLVLGSTLISELNIFERKKS